MHFSKLFKIKEGKSEIFRQWMLEVGGPRREEALETFAHEGITREVFALFRGNDGQDYVIGLNEASDKPLPGDPLVPINQEHSTIKKECLEPISDPGEVLLDLQTS